MTENDQLIMRDRLELFVAYLDGLEPFREVVDREALMNAAAVLAAAHPVDG